MMPPFHNGNADDMQVLFFSDQYGTIQVVLDASSNDTYSDTNVAALHDTYDTVPFFFCLKCHQSRVYYLPLRQRGGWVPRGL